MFIPMNTTIPSQVTLREMLISLQHTLRLLDYVMMWNIYSLTLSQETFSIFCSIIKASKDA